MSLLGPAPARALGLLGTVPNSIGRRLPVSLWLNNLLAFAAFPLIGGIVIRALIGDIHQPHAHEVAKGVTFMLLVFGVFMLTNAVNFAVIVSELRIARGLDIMRNTREMFLPV